MKKAVSMFTGLALGLGLASASFAGGDFNQPMMRHHNINSGHTYNNGGGNGGGGHGGNGGNWGNNGGGYGHGGGGYQHVNYNQGRVITDPKNPASTRDWSRPQAQSVSCIGAGCQLNYPTPQQQVRSHGQLICNNTGCHY